jgi:Peroxisomal membrane protein 24.
MSSSQITPSNTNQLPAFWISTLRGLRNGIYYGGKVRFMHALVITILFKKGTLKDKASHIVQLTTEHAKNLGSYVFTFKALLYLLCRITGKRQKVNHLVSGFLSGYICFRQNTPVNYQITLYLLSRILVGGAQRLADKTGILKDANAYPILAAVCWALVMFLYEDDASTLQPSLKSSMDFLYRDSEQYKSWADFVPIALPDFVVKFINKIIQQYKIQHK